LLVTGAFVVKVFVLVTSFVRLKNENVSVAAVVEYNLFNNILGLEDALFVREFCNVDWRLRVVRGKLFVDSLFLLLLS
jgi:hypothetical protein